MAVKDRVASYGTNLGFRFRTERKFSEMNQGPRCSALAIFSSNPKLIMKKSHPRSIKINCLDGFQRSISLDRREMIGHSTTKDFYDDGEAPRMLHVTLSSYVRATRPSFSFSLSSLLFVGGSFP